MPGAVFPAVLRPARGPVRAVRSAAVALVCTATAVLGHLGAGGTMPAYAAGLVFCGVAAVAWLLSVRRVTPGQMVGLLVLCQVCVHAGGGMGPMTMSAGMVAAHLTATAVSAALLASGEAFVWQLAERLGLRAVPHGVVAAAVPSWRAPIPAVAQESLRDVRLAHSRAERGPPIGH